MPYTQEDLENVTAALASGALSVSVNGETVTYRSQADLLKMRRQIAAELSGGTASQAKLPVRYPAMDRGL